MYFEIVVDIAEIQRIAVNKSIRDLARLREQYGAGRWQSSKVLQRSGLAVVGYGESNYIGMKRMDWEERR